MNIFLGINSLYLAKQANKNNNIKNITITPTITNSANIASSLNILGNYNKAISFKSASNQEVLRTRTLFDFEGEEKAKYLDLAQSYSPMEAAIFVSFNLSEEQIEDYKEIFSSNINYKDINGEQKTYKFQNR